MEISIGCGTPVSTDDPNLASLADNGGPTWTHALLGPSDAIDGGDNGSCESRDQRGHGRPTDGDNNGSSVCDIGAYEIHNEVAIDRHVIPTGRGWWNTAFQFTVTRSGASGTSSVNWATADGSAVAGEDYFPPVTLLHMTPKSLPKPLQWMSSATPPLSSTRSSS